MKLVDIVKKGIWREWFINFYLIIIAVVALLVTTFCLWSRTYYYNSVISRADTYVKGFSLLSTYDYKDFEARAREYAEDFAYKELMEIQIIDRDGKIIVSTTGFDFERPTPQDYTDALASSSGSATWQGQSSTGENIIAKTSLLTDFGKGSNGAVRIIVSLSKANRKIVVACAFIILAGIGVILLAFLSGSYLLKSIVNPIFAARDTAKRISLGDFGARIEYNRHNEIGELCDSINHMASELQHAENLKNEFISSVSHELRTPLTVIRGWGETAKLSLDTDPDLVAKGLEIVLSESARLSELVEDLLDFSRMQSGNFKIDARPMLVSSIMNEAVEMYAELARQRSVELAYLPPKDESKVFVDSNRIKQVFINVIDNAIKYMEGTGQVLITQHEEDGCVTLKINDTGPGIPEVAIDHVKEKFYRYSKSVRGSGIGLAVADEIIKQHNGLLFLESTEGIGTTVTIVLPIYEGDEESVDEIQLAPTGTAEQPAPTAEQKEVTENE